MANARRKRPKGATPRDASDRSPLVWMAVGFVGGCFFSFLVYLSTVEGDPEAPVAVVEPEKPAEEPGRRSTRFDFFTLLPEREVIVPEAETPAIDEQREQDRERVQYVLQAGSFRRAEDADRRRAELLLLGLDAKVEAVQANGDTWHRVYAGPFTSRGQMSRARATLISEGIETLLLRRNLEG